MIEIQRQNNKIIIYAFKCLNVICKITSMPLNAMKLYNLLKTASGHLHTRSVIDFMKMFHKNGN